jgi:hypothetical protein
MEEDVIKKIALASAKQRISPQTGYIHYWIDDPYLPCQDTISILENFIYVYALFRSKTVENIQEAKALLERLLIFEVEGNFPIYLHEFPKCRNPKLSAQMLPTIFYLLKDFSSALGEALVIKLNALSKRIIAFTQSRDEGVSHSPRSPEEWGKLCISTQMAEEDFPQDKVLWNSTLGVFIGDCKERWQEGYEPAVTLLDLFMEKTPKRARADHPIHLKAALVKPWMKKGPRTKEGLFEVIVEEDKRQCLTFYWGGLDRLHSMVLEAKRGTWSIKSSENEWVCTYTYDEELPSEESSLEWAFYLDDAGVKGSNHNITIENEKATVFHPGEEVTIDSKGLKISFQVQVDSFQGSWSGHISKGDRSFQKCKKLAYGGYDWKLGWRTIKREPKASVTIFIKAQIS